MSIDYYSCNCCGETFPDCGYYVSCDCGNHWCSDECAIADGYRIDKEEDDEWEEETSCKYCREEDYDDSELLVYACVMLGITRDELVEKYKKDK